MASTNSNYLEDKIVETYLRNTASGQVATLYLALFTTNPDFELGTGGTEATGGSYARKAIAFNASSWRRT